MPDVYVAVSELARGLTDTEHMTACEQGPDLASRRPAPCRGGPDRVHWQDSAELRAGDCLLFRKACQTLECLSSSK